MRHDILEIVPSSHTMASPSNPAEPHRWHTSNPFPHLALARSSAAKALASSGVRLGLGVSCLV